MSLACPTFPKSNSEEYDPWLNDGVTEVELVDAFLKEGRPEKPLPSHKFKVKVLKADNPMNRVGVIHEVSILCAGFSWGRYVQEIVGAAGLLPKMGIDPKLTDGLYASGVLKGRKLIIEQRTKPGKNDKTYRDYKCVAMETKSVI